MTLELEDAPIEWVVGTVPQKNCPVGPFNVTRLSFLDQLSTRLLQNVEIREYVDLAAFAFWCRQANIERKKAEFDDLENRLGLGLAVHLTPGNVPVNCAFSFVFGLLSGNSNIVRLPTVEFPQIAILCYEVSRLFSDSEFSDIANGNALVRYDSAGTGTSILSKLSNLRMIWGGDDTIAAIRKIDVSPRCIDLVFPDRYSFAVISLKAVLDCNDRDLDTLIHRFYNDTYLFDQDACSSARLIMWHGEEQGNERERFWNKLHEYVENRYSMPLSLAAEKYGRLCSDVMDGLGIAQINRHGNTVYRVELDKLSAKSDEYSGRGGYFYEWVTTDLNDIAAVGSKKSQTLAYFGVEKESLKAVVLENNLLGVDRIVPIGQGLEMDLLWDGYDLIRNMSRIISVK